MILNKREVSIGEASLLLNERLEEDKDNVPKSVILCAEYCKKFRIAANESCIRNIHKAQESVKDQIKEHDLIQFIDLSPMSVEEAKILIPGLSTVDDSVIQKLIRSLEIYRMYDT